MNKNPFIVRQGDVILRRVDTLPGGIKPIKRGKRGIVLAEGEQSGHAHVLTNKGVTHYAAADADVTYLEIKEAMAALVHEEHGTAQLPQGRYEVRIQQTYHRKEIRRVAD